MRFYGRGSISWRAVFFVGMALLLATIGTTSSGAGAQERCSSPRDVVTRAEWVPFKGSSEVVQTWANPRWTHNGIPALDVGLFYERLYSPGNGVVTDVGYSDGPGGYYIDIYFEDDDRTVSVFHMSGPSPLSRCEFVSTGEYIGTTGESNGVPAHLHYQETPGYQIGLPRAERVDFGPMYALDSAGRRIVYPQAAGFTSWLEADPFLVGRWVMSNSGYDDDYCTNDSINYDGDLMPVLDVVLDSAVPVAGTNDGFNCSYLWANYKANPLATDRITWESDLQGRRQLECYVPRSNADATVEYRVLVDLTSAHKVKVDQGEVGGWVALGEYDVRERLRVTLSDNAGGGPVGSKVGFSVCGTRLVREELAETDGAIQVAVVESGSLLAVRECASTSCRRTALLEPGAALDVLCSDPEGGRHETTDAGWFSTSWLKTTQNTWVPSSWVRRINSSDTIPACANIGEKLHRASKVFCGGLEATVVGTPENDVIYGSDRVDVISGLQGDDQIFGLGGDDVICGGMGNDTLYGGQGFDIMYGAQGNDFIYSSDGASASQRMDVRGARIFGGAGNDQIYGSNRWDRMQGGSGNDALFGFAGRDWLRGGPGSDDLRGGTNVDDLHGGNGNDRIEIEGGDFVRGGAGKRDHCPVLRFSKDQYVVSCEL